MGQLSEREKDLTATMFGAVAGAAAIFPLAAFLAIGAALFAGRVGDAGSDGVDLMLAKMVDGMPLAIVVFLVSLAVGAAIGAFVGRTWRRGRETH